MNNFLKLFLKLFNRVSTSEVIPSNNFAPNYFEALVFVIRSSRQCCYIYVTNIFNFFINVCNP